METRMTLKGDDRFWPEALSVWLSNKERIGDQRTAVLYGNGWRAWYRRTRLTTTITTEEA